MQQNVRLLTLLIPVTPLLAVLTLWVVVLGLQGPSIDSRLVLALLLMIAVCVLPTSITSGIALVLRVKRQKLSTRIATIAYILTHIAIVFVIPGLFFLAAQVIGLIYQGKDESGWGSAIPFMLFILTLPIWTAIVGPITFNILVTSLSAKAKQPPKAIVKASSVVSTRLPVLAVWTLVLLLLLATILLMQVYHAAQAE